MPDKHEWIELAKLTHQDFVSRRGLEWKLSLGLWGSIAAFVYTVIQKTELHQQIDGLLSPCCNSFFIPIIASIVIGFGHIFVLRLIQTSHARDKKLYWWLRGCAEGTLKTTDRPWDAKLDENPPPDKLGGDPNRANWFRFHIAITVLVLIMAWTLLLNSPPKP